MLCLVNILCPQGKENQGKKNCNQPTQEELGWGQEIKMRMNLAFDVAGTNYEEMNFFKRRRKGW